MRCPYCKEVNSDKVIDTRLSEGGNVIRRRRVCLDCEKRFTTKERIEREVKLLVMHPEDDVLGSLVAERLREIDQIAYVRFASVYRQFEDLGELIDEAQDVIDRSTATSPGQQKLFE